MRERKGRKGVWKHFYDPNEAWQRFASGNIDALRDEAHAAGAPRPYDREADVEAMPLGARGKLGDHHAEYYAPVYLEEVRTTPSKRQSPGLIQGEFRQMGVSPHGVQWSRELRKKPHVITAFRPQLATNRPGTDEDYAETALRRLEGHWRAARRRRK